jgi:hypothetical protein
VAECWLGVTETGGSVPAVLVASYTLFSFFIFYQQLHVKNFGGASQGYLGFLSLFAFVAMLGGFGFLLYFGYKVSWLGALGLFAISLVVKFAWFAVEARLSLRGAAPFISLAGFIGIPACAFLLWWSFPK